MKIVTVVGARPQFIKAGPVSRSLCVSHQEILVHTGHHYDDNMSGVFFRELGIPEPDYNLGIGGGTHGQQTGRMLEAIERVLMTEKPDWLLVYGDTNSTLAAALAAAKLHIRVAHIEAGLRSYNQQMPEEINRVMTDHLSALLLCPSQSAADNLKREGIERTVRIVGDVMVDSLYAAMALAKNHSDVYARLNICAGAYVLATIHRAENMDDWKRLTAILGGLSRSPVPVIIPLHPRTRKILEARDYVIAPILRIVEPFGYIDMVAMASGARLIATDSGGLQKEAYWLSVPCLTLRDETEWVETVQTGWNKLVGADGDAIASVLQEWCPPRSHSPLYGEGNASSAVVAALEEA